VLPAADPVGLAGHGASAFQDFLDGLHARSSGSSSTGNNSVGIPVVSDYADNPWPIFFDASGPANTSITRASMAYCVKEYRAWPRRWVVEATTPFIHPALYANSASARTVPGGGEMATALGLGSSLSGLPPVLQDAFAVSATYAAKNDANSDLVMQLVEAKTTALLYSPEQGNWTIMEQLAALQALLVYQMIRLFDGDIRQRAMAETVEPVQAAWTAVLQARLGGEIFQGADLQQAASAHPLNFSTASSAGQFPSGVGGHGGNAVAVSDGAATAWQRWLFNETARRTIITSFMIRGIYAMAKQGYCRLGPVVTDMSFTSGSRPWAAKTPGRWQRAVRETDPGWINRMDFMEMLGRADPGNVDEFGVMMAVTYRGKDVIEDWMDREL
jgi:hypothetical protein